MTKKRQTILIAAIAGGMAVLIAAAVLIGVLAGGGSTPSSGADTVINGFNFGDISQKSELSVLDYGADNTGATDDTKLLQALHKTGKKIYYPNGTYRFNGPTLELSGGVRFESMDGVTVRNDISDMNILRFDDFGNLIGLMQNHLEYNERSILDRCGSLVSPPLSTKKYETKADLLAYWYNDFGLESTRTGKTGWVGWFYWTWNHHDVLENGVFRAMLEDGNREPDPYDPSRHPLLGFYYGDDPVVLDWQSYWLYEYGVQNVVILAEDFTNWEDPECTSHWAYQLFNHAPNFKNLNYAITVSTPWWDGKDETVPDKVRQQWLDTAALYAQYDNYYSIEKNGKKYPVISLLEEKALATVFDDGGAVANTRQFFIDMTNAFKEKGFDGVALFSRNPIAQFNTESERAFFESIGMVRYEATYTPNYVPSNWAVGSMTYPDVVDAFNPPSDPFVIQSIANSMDTQTPHESRWNCPGNNPQDFQRWIEKCLTHLDNNPDMKRIITLYNISEWAEGGPGLQPNVQDGFGYLEAIRNAIMK